MNEIPSGSIGLDVGCGNGKYLKVNPNIFIVASDRWVLLYPKWTSVFSIVFIILTAISRSEALATIAKQHQPHSAIVADTLNLPHPDGHFDFAISIAVVHHLSLPERRVKAISSILDTLKPPTEADPVGGKALIYVWALEQKDSRRGWDVDHDQDVMVPWVLKTAEEKKPKVKKGRGKKNSDAMPTNVVDEEPKTKQEAAPTTYLRYYHLYKENELENDIAAAHGRILDHGYEKDNWWAVACPLPRS